MFSGADPFAAGMNYGYQVQASVHRVKQARLLMTPDEVLNMPEDKQVIFISGKNLMPIYADKFPYFTNPAMAGAFMPNPYHPPMDSVQVITRSGAKRKPVITERVPAEFAHYPQYESGDWSFIKGYRPTTDKPQRKRRKWKDFIVSDTWYRNL
jgi:type IV secretion system protein VirD4